MYSMEPIFKEDTHDTGLDVVPSALVEGMRLVYLCTVIGERLCPDASQSAMAGSDSAITKDQVSQEQEQHFFHGKACDGERNKGKSTISPLAIIPFS